MYPQSVQEATDKYMTVTNRLFGMNLEGEILTDVKEFINHYFFQKFIKGNDVSLEDENEVKYIQSYIVSRMVVYELTEKGFMGMYKDEDTKPGEEIIYLTKTGKQYLNEYFNEKDDYDPQTIDELAEYISGSNYMC